MFFHSFKKQIKEKDPGEILIELPLESSVSLVNISINLINLISTSPYITFFMHK